MRFSVVGPVAAISFFSAANAATLVIDIADDGFGSETSFDITDKTTGAVVAGISIGTIPDFGFVTTTFTEILTPGEYLFTIRDFFGDGIIAPGGYQLTLDGAVLVRAFSGQFSGFSQTTAFTVETGNPVPLPAAGLMFAAGAASMVGLKRRKRRT